MTPKERKKRRKSKNKRRNKTLAMPVLTYDELRPTVCRDATLEDLGIIPAMLATLTKAPDGVGLAAPQIGHDVRIVVIWPGRAQGKYPEVLVNPILRCRSEEKSTGVEGCLSYPGLQANVERHDAVWVDHYDISAKCGRSKALDGFAARVLQHEIDHLDGVCKVYNDKRKAGE